MTILQQPNLTQLAPSVIYDRSNQIVYFGCDSTEVEGWLKTFRTFSRCEDMEVRETPKLIKHFNSEIVIRDMQEVTDYYAHGIDTLVQSEKLRHWDKRPPAPTGNLSEEKLRELNEEHDRMIEDVHQWCWAADKLELIDEIRQLHPEWDDDDLYERLGEGFIDWDKQELNDENDWEQSYLEVASAARLTQRQRNQLKSYLMGEELDETVTEIRSISVTELLVTK